MRKRLLKDRRYNISQPLIFQYVSEEKLMFWDFFIYYLYACNINKPSLFVDLYVCVPDIWSEQSFQTDPDLPPGWKKITDMAGIYYWHIPTGTTQWERPATYPAQPGEMESKDSDDHPTSTPQHTLGSLSPSIADLEVSDRKTSGNTHYVPLL